MTRNLPFKTSYYSIFIIVSIENLFDNWAMAVVIKTKLKKKVNGKICLNVKFYCCCCCSRRRVVLPAASEVVDFVLSSSKSDRWPITLFVWEINLYEVWNYRPMQINYKVQYFILRPHRGWYGKRGVKICHWKSSSSILIDHIL